MAQHNNLRHLTLIMSALLLSCFLHILASSNHSEFRAEMKKPLRLSDNNQLQLHVLFFSRVMCDAYTPAGEPIPTNKRLNAAKIFSNPDVVKEEPWYGIEQELQKDVKWPIGWPIGGFAEGITNCSLLEELNISQARLSVRSLTLPSNFYQGKFPMSITNRESLEVNENRGFDSWELSESFTGLTKIQVTAQAFLSSGWVLFLLPEVLDGVREARRRIAATANTFIFIITFLALLGICCADLHPKDIFILAGQSNMSGRGGAIVNHNIWDGLVPPECKPNPSITQLSVNFTWEEAREPLHRGYYCSTSCGVGPGLPFANSLLRLQSSVKRIGLVPCAVGGTRIAEWNRSGDYYKTLISKTLASTKNGGILRALLWYQGESDTNNEEDAECYGTRLVEFMNNVRTDLSSPTLPIIQVALASGKNYTYIKMVRHAQLGLRLENLTCVDAWKLELEPDKLHLTTHSQVLLGKKMARAFIANNY